MVSDGEIPVEERMLQLLQHLGIKQAHFAARQTSDWSGLVSNHPEALSSLTLVCPRGIGPGILGSISERLLVIAGDQGPPAATLKKTIEKLSNATLASLGDYLFPMWADVIADHSSKIGATMSAFLSTIPTNEGNNTVGVRKEDGDFAGISYSVRGFGPPLVLMPLELAPSQWEPLLSQLQDQFCTILVGGAALGMVSVLETRAQEGYGALLRGLMDELGLKPGETVLDVGSGSGVHDRWLARSTGGENPITAIDFSPYLIREATALAKKEGLEGVIQFGEGDAESIPFPDNSFDVSISVTVMEEVDAERMMAEMYRVTKPAGRVAVIVRSVDLPNVVNLPLGINLKAKVEAPNAWGSGVGKQGCADSSLYQRFSQAGLSSLKMLPQLATFANAANLEYLQGNITSILNVEETEEWYSAVDQVQAEGTFFISRPFHCAVGTKP